MAGVGPPDTVRVLCNGVPGIFLLADSTVICGCTECAAALPPELLHNPHLLVQTCRSISPTEFERHAGMGATRKWRHSIKVVVDLPPHAPLTAVSASAGGSGAGSGAGEAGGGAPDGDGDGGLPGAGGATLINIGRWLDEHPLPPKQSGQSNGGGGGGGGGGPSKASISRAERGSMRAAGLLGTLPSAGAGAGAGGGFGGAGGGRARGSGGGGGGAAAAVAAAGVFKSPYPRPGVGGGMGQPPQQQQHMEWAQELGGAALYGGPPAQLQAAPPRQRAGSRDGGGAGSKPLVQPGQRGARGGGGGVTQGGPYGGLPHDAVGLSQLHSGSSRPNLPALSMQTKARQQLEAPYGQPHMTMQGGVGGGGGGAGMHRQGSGADPSMPYHPAQGWGHPAHVAAGGAHGEPSPWGHPDAALGGPPDELAPMHSLSHGGGFGGAPPGRQFSGSLGHQHQHHQQQQQQQQQHQPPLQQQHSYMTSSARLAAAAATAALAAAEAASSRRMAYAPNQGFAGKRPAAGDAPPAGRFHDEAGGGGGGGGGGAATAAGSDGGPLLQMLADTAAMNGALLGTSTDDLTRSQQVSPDGAARAGQPRARRVEGAEAAGEAQGAAAPGGSRGACAPRVGAEHAASQSRSLLRVTSTPSRTRTPCAEDGRGGAVPATVMIKGEPGTADHHLQRDPHPPTQQQHHAAAAAGRGAARGGHAHDAPALAVGDPVLPPLSRPTSLDGVAAAAAAALAGAPPPPPFRRSPRRLRKQRWNELTLLRERRLTRVRAECEPCAGALGPVPASSAHAPPPHSLLALRVLPPALLTALPAPRAAAPQPAPGGAGGGAVAVRLSVDGVVFTGVLAREAALTHVEAVRTALLLQSSQVCATGGRGADASQRRLVTRRVVCLTTSAARPGLPQAPPPATLCALCLRPAGPARAAAAGPSGWLGPLVAVRVTLSRPALGAGKQVLPAITTGTHTTGGGGPTSSVQAPAPTSHTQVHACESRCQSVGKELPAAKSSRWGSSNGGVSPARRMRRRRSAAAQRRPRRRGRIPRRRHRPPPPPPPPRPRTGLTTRSSQALPLRHRRKQRRQRGATPRPPPPSPPPWTLPSRPHNPRTPPRTPTATATLPTATQPARRRRRVKLHRRSRRRRRRARRPTRRRRRTRNATTPAPPRRPQRRRRRWACRRLGPRCSTRCGFTCSARAGAPRGGRPRGALWGCRRRSSGRPARAAAAAGGWAPP